MGQQTEGGRVSLNERSLFTSLGSRFNSNNKGYSTIITVRVRFIENLKESRIAHGDYFIMLTEVRRPITEGGILGLRFYIAQ